MRSLPAPDNCDCARWAVMEEQKGSKLKKLKLKNKMNVFALPPARKPSEVEKKANYSFKLESANSRLNAEPVRCYYRVEKTGIEFKTSGSLDRYLLAIPRPQHEHLVCYPTPRTAQRHTCEAIRPNTSESEHSCSHVSTHSMLNSHWRKREKPQQTRDLNPGPPERASKRPNHWDRVGLPLACTRPLALLAARWGGHCHLQLSYQLVVAPVSFGAGRGGLNPLRLTRLWDPYLSKCSNH